MVNINEMLTLLGGFTLGITLMNTLFLNKFFKMYMNDLNTNIDVSDVSDDDDDDEEVDDADDEEDDEEDDENDLKTS